MAHTHDKQQTAIHEAGHAVAHCRLSIEHDGAHIVPDDEAGLLGAAIGAGIRHVWSEPEAQSMVIAFCAGYGALIAAGYPDDVAIAGTDDDFGQAQQLLSFWSLSGHLDDWKARAVQLMRKPENVAAVALVARHLLDRERLDGEFVDVLVEVADGESTEADLHRYLMMRSMA